MIIILFFFFLSFFSNFSFKIGNLSSISLESYLISNEKMIAAIQKILFSASISRNIWAEKVLGLSWKPRACEKPTL